MFRFIKDLKVNIDNNSPLKQAIIFSTDTKELFVDINNSRMQISDIIIVNTEEELTSILAPISNKFYYVISKNRFFRFSEGEWKGVQADDAVSKAQLGNLDNLSTDNKDSIVDAINELFQNVDNGKSLLASAITDKGIDTLSDASFATMAENIRNISLDVAVFNIKTKSEDVLSGKTYLSSEGIIEEGTIPVNEPEDISIGCGEKYTIPEGHHNGSGTVSVPELSTFTQANATPEVLFSGYDAFVNGERIEGSFIPTTIYMGSNTPTDDIGRIGDVYFKL
jgi:hypothetical protein